ncbi:hypothetical protein HU200_029836 [Digitaria exilis]|uniref:Uncharacterized protein n=1 Tax=Digitaria exilis TaxID=1010633 RepID=A0A835ET23_9POAL|nr:hypothetical protein HU200_029836 [Digitaria exilis]
MFDGGTRVCRRSMLLCGFYLRRHCREIISSGFLRSPVAIYSDANREAGETCVGVQGRRFIVFFSWPMRLGGSVLGICA